MHKINLIRSVDKAMENYLNICPFFEDKDKNVVLGEFSDLNSLVGPATCNEILALNIVDYVGQAELVPLLQHLASKLRHGGSLVVSGTDLYETARSINIGAIPLNEGMNMLYGDANNVLDMKRCTYSLNAISEVLKNFGLKIMSKRLQDYMFYIKAERP